jgi:hypothetical protein
LKKDWIASSLTLLAMTNGKTGSRRADKRRAKA